MKKHTPSVGQVIPCSRVDCSFKNSNTPCIRLIHDTQNDTWQVSKDPLKGYLVYIAEPKNVVLDKIKAVRLTAVSPTSAKAEVYEP